MTITVESTSQVVSFNGIPCRMWEGKTAAGVPMHCFIARIAVAPDQDTSQFEAELKENKPPRPDLAYPLRMLI